jgi:hypothetical protein
MVKELDKEKLKFEAYQFLLGKHMTLNHDNSRFDEFKELIQELIQHANEYNEINSKFFGRDAFMQKVIIYTIHKKLDIEYFF